MPRLKRRSRALQPHRVCASPIFKVSYKATARTIPRSPKRKGVEAADKLYKIMLSMKTAPGGCKQPFTSTSCSPLRFLSSHRPTKKSAEVCGTNLNNSRQTESGHHQQTKPFEDSEPVEWRMRLPTTSFTKPVIFTMFRRYR